MTDLLMQELVDRALKLANRGATELVDRPISETDQIEVSIAVSLVSIALSLAALARKAAK